MDIEKVQRDDQNILKSELMSGRIDATVGQLHSFQHRNVLLVR
jgi:predicted methyltransferase MtxX (methanogen marker protein 4)